PGSTMAEGVENILAATEDFDIDLDELGIDIPPIGNAPTLESILNEPDAESAFDDEDDVDIFNNDAGDSSSMSSQEGILSDSKIKLNRKKDESYAIHGSILRHVILKGISSQLMSAADRVNAGMPTAIAVNSMISVGTSHGLVLVFDPKQVLKWCLGSTAVGAQYGAVSALSFNRDCTRLLCGFAKGQITMWDLTNGKLIRTITDAHPPGTAVLHVKFTDDLTIAICCDSGGSVFELEMKRLIGVRKCESKCLFSGSRGEVCIVEPLHMNYTVKDHPMKDVMILAMASFSKVLLVRLRPQLKVMFAHPLKGDPATLPLLAWQFVIIQVSQKDRVIDPVLAFGRDQTIHFYQVVCNSPEDIKMCPLQKMELSYKLMSISWMNSRTLVTIDSLEKVHVIDVRTEEEIEVIDISGIELVYGTSYFKSLATGGNVSKALAYAGERACYNSIVSYTSQLILLGTKSVHVMTMRKWDERINVLVKQNNYKDALALAQSFYSNKARAVVGLAGNIQRRKVVVAEKMLQLLHDFVDRSMTTDCPQRGSIQELESHYLDVVPVCVDYCLNLDRMDILFGEIYEKFSADMIAHGFFLECLEPYILSDRLVFITPVVMKDFVNHYEQKGMLQDVEACIVHLDIASLDIHQVVILCWSHGLYDAILYVYNKGMNDYTTPLEELLRLLRAAVITGKQLTDEQIKLGNKLLVYISCCLAGRAYPLGDIPEHLVSVVKEDVTKSITCLHTKNPDSDEPVYPHLKSLLQFDTREFLNVLALAFEEEEFNTEDGVNQRQRIVDILLQIMVESVGFTPSQIGMLFTFLARLMARHENKIMVNRLLFEQVLEFLSKPGEGSRHEEREQALLELLHAGGFQQFDEKRLLTLAENAKFFRVCELLYQKQRRFDKILSCYWNDPARQDAAFNYIEVVMLSAEYTAAEKQSVEIEACSHIQELVGIDAGKTAQLVLVGFNNPLSDTIGKLEPNPELLYKFLHGVFEYKESNGSAIYSEKQITLEANIHERFIDLMCQHEPNSVYTYLKGAEGYRLEETLNICRRRQVTDATAYLLEKAGDIHGAFNIILENLQHKLDGLTGLLIEQAKNNTTNDDIPISMSSVQSSLTVLIQLCQRNTGKMNEQDRESLWFPLLETMMAPYRKVKDLVDKDCLQEFKEMTRHVLNSMSGYISLPAILQKIMQDPTYSTGKFEEIKDLILGMLETYNYEKTLLNTCNSLLNHDLHAQLTSLTRVATRGYIARSNSCSLCNKTFSASTDNDTAIVFKCSHAYHIPCLQSTGSSHMVDGEEQWVCYLCNSSKRGVAPSSRIQRLSSKDGTQQAPSIKPDKTKKEVYINPQQIQAIDNLKKSQKTRSRLVVLHELSKMDTAASKSSKQSRSGSSILSNENFQLRLAAPPGFDRD
ncbi:unnamed protein product, partial [Owenia fusiformis]